MRLEMNQDSSFDTVRLVKVSRTRALLQIYFIFNDIIIINNKYINMYSIQVLYINDKQKKNTNNGS